MLGITIVLGAGALYAPDEALRFGALIGMAVSGAAYLWQSGVAVRGYLSDVDRVVSGLEVPGHVRVEVESDVGYDWTPARTASPSPHARRRPLSSGEGPEGGPPPTGEP
jgi:hypothetical protein